MLEIKSQNPNYVAKVFRVEHLRPHPNADRLQIATVDNQNVITDLKCQLGDVYVFFPVECAINSDFLAWSNSFSDKELNADKTKTGFFGKNGRVRCVKLRQVPSEGYIIPFVLITDWLSSLGHKVKFDDSMIDLKFDHFDKIEICHKYVVPSKTPNEAGDRSKRKIKCESKIIDGQFRLSEDTEHLKRNIHKINPEDLISVGFKMHGANGVISKVLCKRKLNPLEKFLKFVGVKIQDAQYDVLFASRRVLKNADINKNANHFYDTDIWGIIAERYKHTLKDGISLYGEIVGQLPNGKWIQREYDYGVPSNECDFFVYRITYTSPAGDVFEFTTPQIQRYCEAAGLKTVPIFYYGRAKDLFPELSVSEHWRENFLQKMIDAYTEKRCFMCQNDVPEEGVVLIRESGFYEAYKLKSINFLARESAQIDAEEEDIDDAN